MEQSPRIGQGTGVRDAPWLKALGVEPWSCGFAGKNPVRH